MSPWLRLVGVGALFGALSALLTYALRSALQVEPAYADELVGSGGLGPSALLILAGLAGGYLAAVLVEALGLGGIAAILGLGLSAVSALGVSVGAYAVATGGVPEVVWLANAASAVAWLLGGVLRLFLG